MITGAGRKAGVAAGAPEDEGILLALSRSLAAFSAASPAVAALDLPCHAASRVGSFFVGEELAPQQGASEDTHLIIGR